MSDEAGGVGRMCSLPAACEVAVVGAGPAGAALARRLAIAGVSVALLERSCLEFPRIGESLAPAVQPELIDLGVWREFQALEPLPSYGTCSHWGDLTPQVHSHLMNPWGSGWHVDRPAFDRMLAQAALEAGARLVTDVSVLSCLPSGDGWALTLGAETGHPASHRELRARIVVDATGRAASIASRLGAARALFDQLVGVASLFEDVDVTCESFVMVETARSGWWYSAPVPNGGLMVMAMTDGDLCGRLRLSRGEEWAAQLAATAATSARAGVGRHAWGPRVFSAASHRLIRSEWTHPWLAVGDAALAVDPISGSGVVRALRSARRAAHAALALLDGAGADAIRSYEIECDRDCTAYLEERAGYYDLETRWPDAAFWTRRHVYQAQ